jgi:hypothetical protein
MKFPSGAELEIGIAVYVLAMFGGHYLVRLILKLVRWHTGQKSDKPESLDMWIGCTERAVAITMVIWTPTYVPAFIGAWVALKMAANWQRLKGESEEVRRGSLIALLGNVYSFAIAIGAGLYLNPDAIKAWVPVAKAVSG